MDHACRFLTCSDPLSRFLPAEKKEVKNLSTGYHLLAKGTPLALSNEVQNAVDRFVRARLARLTGS